MFFLTKYNPSKEESFFHAIIIGILIGLTTWIFFNEFAVTLAASSLSFAIWSKFADNRKIDNTEKLLLKSNMDLSKSRKLIHGEYALKKIIYLRSILSKSTVAKSAIPYALYELENILNQMYKCCSIGNEKETFKQKKGIIGNFKTQVEIANKDADLRPKYNEFIAKLQEIQVFIEEL